MSPLSLTAIPYRENALEYMERLLDFESPLLFDSGRPGSTAGRYDIFTSSPLYTITYQGGICSDSRSGPAPLGGQGLVDHLNQVQKRIESANTDNCPEDIPFTGGLAGFASYDLGRAWEEIPSIAKRDIDLPELFVGYFPWSGVLDHARQRAWLCFQSDCPPALRALIQAKITEAPNNFIRNKHIKINELKNEIDVNSYSRSISRVKEYIQSGDCYQVNLSQRFSGDYEGNPWLAYLCCRKSMMSPFSVYLGLKTGNLTADNAILSFSPERFLRLEGGNVLTQPIKGTAARNPDPELDALAASELHGSEKNRAENLMIVDLLRNDLGKCCNYGSVKSEKLFEIQTFSNVHHLVSSISGKLRTSLTAFDLLHSAFPGGSITGAPKIRAMEIIEELEPTQRSIYCGSLFYINTKGDMDSNIAIRTLLFLNGRTHCWGGGGIVSDSHPEQEYEESLLKIRRILESIKSIKTRC